MEKEYVFLDLKDYKKTKYIECIKVNNGLSTVYCTN